MLACDRVGTQKPPENRVASGVTCHIVRYERLEPSRWLKQQNRCTAPRSKPSSCRVTFSAQLSTQYPIRSVFLGWSRMTLDRLDRFPARSVGHSLLPEEKRRQIAQDIPPWSEFIRQEAERFGYPYVDMVNDFPQRLAQAEAVLTLEILP